MKKNCLFLLAIFAIFFNVACSDDKKEEVNCTYVFVSIPLKVVNKENEPISLDRFRVTINDKDIQLDKDLKDEDPILMQMQKWGTYLIVDDGMRKELFEKRIAVHITGYIKDKKVIDKVFDVSADECHVYPVTDADEFKIVLDLK